MKFVTNKPKFTCCDLPIVNKHLRIVEDQYGNKLQWWGSESVANKIDSLNPNGECIVIKADR